MTRIVQPSTDLYDSWLECVEDFGGGPMDGSGDWQVPDFAPNRRSFDTLLERIQVESDPTSSLSLGRVHSDYFWVFAETTMIGFLAVRHSIDNGFLRTAGGHVGYSIRPSYRRQGHASRALGLGLARARQLGLNRLLLTCDVDNLGSARTIEGQGGVFETTMSGKKRYWIDLDRAGACG